MSRFPRIICVIPARLASTRFPEKMIAPLNGKPLIEHVWRAACKVSFFKEVILAIDSPKLEKIVKAFGGNYVMTSPDHQSGTSRVSEVVLKKANEADIWINWQGDEPFVNETIICDLLNNWDDRSIDMWTLSRRINNLQEIKNQNVTKIVKDAHNNALYFSRSPIPFYRSECTKPMIYYKHIGIYAYTTKTLLDVASKPPCYLENAETLEQLQFLYYGKKIRVNETEHEVYEVNTPEDLARAQNYIARLQQTQNITAV